MVRNLLIVIVLLFSANVAVFAQAGALKGKVLDKSTKEPVPFANIVVENNGTQAGGTTSDINGEYTIKPLTPGKYDIKATFIGYKPVLVRGFVVRTEKTEFQDILMEPTATQLETYEVIDYKVPLISKDNTTTGQTVTSEEISKMPSRNASAVAASVGGVFSRDGEIGSIRGQRSEGNVMYIDGIKVRGSSGLPESAIEQVSVILGGVPAQYGDATGGIINVTTKGPSRHFGGGLELQTSEYLDPYGYNRAGVNFTGPLIRNKEKNTSLLGYFVAADFEYKKDGSPLPLGTYKVKDDILDEIRLHPLLRTETGSVGQAAEEIRADDLEKIKSTLNSNEFNINTSAKLDIKAGKNSNLTLGGSYNAYNNHDYSWYNSLFNSDRNSLSTGNTWRVFGRYTQRFPAEKDSKSFIKNVYYNLQADYTSIAAKTEDADLKDNLFGYGYLGKFSTYTTKNYEPVLDTLEPLGFRVEMRGYRDTLITYERSELNPIMANYVTDYYTYYADQVAGYRDMVSNILGNNGLINGYTPNERFDGIFGRLWSSPGGPQAGYATSDTKQVTANLNLSADVGNHEIKLGFTFEKLSARSYSYAPTVFWTKMYQLANSHISEINTNDPIVYYEPVNDTLQIKFIDYKRLYDGTSQRFFDKQLRSLMGLRENGLEWIDINSYDINSMTINYYDEDNVMHTTTLNKPLSVELFSPDEFLTDKKESQFGAARGYDYYGNKLTYSPTLLDFFQKKDANGNYLREIAPFEPIYMAGYIQDKFAFDDLVFNVGLRFDRFDANQSVLKDPFSLYPVKTAGQVRTEGTTYGTIPESIGDEYYVYVDNVDSPTKIMGFRNEAEWFDANGSVLQSPDALNAGNGVSPFLVSTNKEITADCFSDYKPQWTMMPRISFSFPISDEALFYAHYDVLTQRPKTNFALNPIDYYFWPIQGGMETNNPNLKPEKTVDYELGFQQKLSNSSSINISGFYREFRDQIQAYRYAGAYPSPYTSYNNIDFGTVKGLTISYDLRRTVNARIRASYTLQFANGTGSNSETALSLVRIGQPNLRTLIPYDYDRRHAFNLNIDFRYSEGKEYNGPVWWGKQIFANAGFNITMNGGSGTPYTRSSLVSPLGQSRIILGSINGSRMPGSVRFDGRVDKDFTLSSKKDEKGNAHVYYLNVYLQVLNILNSQNIMNVYGYTGNADDDGYLAAAQYQAQIAAQGPSYVDLYRIRVNNPYNYSSPRLIRLGIGINF